MAQPGSGGAQQGWGGLLSCTTHLAHGNLLPWGPIMAGTPWIRGEVETRTPVQPGVPLGRWLRGHIAARGGDGEAARCWWSSCILVASGKPPVIHKRKKT